MPVEVRTIRGVELVRVGTWSISTGEWTVTADDLASAVAAHRAGVLRRPVIKLGHVGPMRDASPALGYVDNLRTADGGTTLVGNLVDVPNSPGVHRATVHRPAARRYRGGGRNPRPSLHRHRLRACRQHAARLGRMHGLAPRRRPPRCRRC